MKERIEELERAVDELVATIEGMRRWIIWLSVAVGLIGLSFAFRVVNEVLQERFGMKVVSASAFRVVRDGKTVGLIGSNDDGGTILLLNPSGKVVAQVSALGAGGWLEICDKNGVPMVAIFANDTTAGGSIQVLRQKGMRNDIAVGMGCHQKGHGWIYATDALGRLIWFAP